MSHITTIKRNKKCNVGETNLGNLVLLEKAEDTANKLEGIKFNHPMFENVNELYFRKGLSRLISLQGSAAVGFINTKAGMLPVVVETPVYEYVGKKLYSLSGTYGKKVIGGISTTLYCSWGYLNGVVNYSTYYLTELKEKVLVDSKDLDVDEIPAVLFLNNFAGLPDVEYYNVWNLVESLNRIGNTVEAEYYRSRTTYLFNEQFTDMDGDKVMKNIDSGKHQAFIEDSAHAGVGAGMIPIIKNPSVVTHTMPTAFMLKIELKEHLHMVTDSQQTGTNKHTAEIIDKDAEYTENILHLREARQETWHDLFKLYARITEEEVELPPLKLSRILQSKLDLMDASVETARASSQNTLAQSDNKNKVS